MNIKPLADRVLVLPAQAEEKKYAGTELELDGKKYLIMRQSDILAII